MERPVKTASKFLSKVVRSLALYFILTVGVFFGYTQVAKDMLIPTEEGEAVEESFFTSFVNNIMATTDVDADFLLTVDNEALSIALDGNLVVNVTSKEVSLDLDLKYTDKTQVVATQAASLQKQEENFDRLFEISAIFVSPNLYLQIDDKNYKFDVNSGLDFSALMELIGENVAFGNQTLNDVLNMLGLGDIDLDVLVPDLLAQLQKDPVVLDNGDYQIDVIVEKLLKARLICDSEYYLKSVRLANGTVINGNAVTFEANNIKMNTYPTISFDETAVEVVDMSGISYYLGYAQNFAKQPYGVVDLSLQIGEENYTGKLLFENVETPKVKIETNYEGINISVVYLNDEIYFDIDNLKMNFKLEDYFVWQNKINTIVEKHTNKTVSQLLDEFMRSYFGNKDISPTKIMLSILAGGVNSQEKVVGYLPENTLLTENNFEMLWDNGMKVVLGQNEEVLTSAYVKGEDFESNVTFKVEQTSVETSGEYYNLSKMLPVLDVVDQIYSQKQFSGRLKEYDVSFKVDFQNTIVAIAETNILGEDVVVSLENNLIKLKIGEVVIEGQVEHIKNYIAEIERIFGLSFSEEDVERVDAITAVAGALKEISLIEAEGSLAIVEALGAKAVLSRVGDNLLVEVEYEDISLSAEIYASNESFDIANSTDKMDSILTKIEKTKTYIESKVYSFTFDVDYNKISMEGEAYVDLNNNIFEVTGITIGNNTLNARYETGIVYVDYAGNKIKA
ncbi:MAG: hypothetical protein E7375_04070, partial [Clostridiales bacterium]|nr:hypothetical protein [Clostridiales bacterium]